MALLRQSTAYNRAFLMVLSSDHVTGATGKTVTVNLSKACAAFGAAAGTVTEISSGWYKVALTTADSGTLGDLAYDCTASGCDPTDFCDQVIAVDFSDTVRAGLTALPNAAAAAASGLPVLGTNATAISFTGGMTISSSGGDALTLSSSGGNGSALAAAGNGTGAGIKATAGATGNGLQVIGGATSGSAIKASGTAGNAIALELAGQGSAAGLSATGGATGIGITAVGGATSGSGMKATGTAGNAIALEIVGQGSAAGIQSTGGATGSAFKLVGGGTSGHGLAVTTTSGDGFNLTPTAGNGITATANGTSKHGIVATGGTAGTSDGLKAAAGTGGVDIRGAQTGDITGALSGAVGSVTGAVGSVTARVTANTDQWAGTTIPAPAVTGVPKVDLVDIAGATVSTSSAQLGVNAVQIGAAVPGSATIGTVTTTTTATNLTNAPTSGDLTSTMKTSVENAVWDAARSSHLATGVFGQLGQEILRDNTATAGAASTITLDASASTTVDQYRGDVLYIYSGTGSGQSRVISAYSAGRVATVVPAWVTTPDNTSKFILTAQRTPLVGTDTRILTSADVSTSGETVAAVTGAVGSVTGAVGSVTGAVESVTGAVGSVTGNVGGNVVGSVASVTARVTANTDQWAGTTIPAPAVTGVPKVDLVDIAGATVSTSTAQLGVNAVQIGAAVPASATIGTVTTTTTATNLTNAPTAGDFTAAMKTSLNAATPASVVGAVGSVTGNVGGNVVGSTGSVVGAVGSVTAAVSLSSNDSPVVQSGTAQGGGASTITLSSGASATDDLYNGQTVKTTGGAGPSQVRIITGYVGSTKVATVDRAWATNPDVTTTYAVLATDHPKTNSSLEVVSASVTGAVGSVAGAVASVTGNVGGNVVGSVGSVTGAVGSVTGNVGGNVVGSVASVTADVGITQAGADKVWSTTVRTLSAAGVQAIWDALTSALTTVGSIGKLLVTNIDATISSRSTYAGGAVASVTADVTVGTNNDKTGYRLSATGVDDVWDELTSGHATTGTTGKALIDAGATGADPWDTLLPGSYAPGSAGDIVGNNLDAAVSSRSTYAGADTSGTTTILGRLTSGRATNLDNLDAAVSTRSSHSAADVWSVGTRTLTAFTIAVDITSAAVSSIWDKLLSGITTASTIGKLIKDNLDAAISTRLETAGYTAPDNADIVLIKAKTDNLPAAPAAVSDIPTAASNASATWDAVRASHTTSGTFGQGVSSVQGNLTGSAASVTADVGITQAGADKAWSTATRALTDKAGFALTSAYDPAKTAAQAGDAMALTSGERDSVAQAALKLDWTTVTGAASRSTLNALRFLRNKWSFVGTTLTVTEEDDTTSAWTGEATTSSSAEPITSVDPS